MRFLAPGGRIPRPEPPEGLKRRNLSAGLPAPGPVPGGVPFSWRTFVAIPQTHRCLEPPSIARAFFANKVAKRYRFGASAPLQVFGFSPISHSVKTGVLGKTPSAGIEAVILRLAGRALFNDSRDVFQLSATPEASLECFVVQGSGDPAQRVPVLAEAADFPQDSLLARIRFLVLPVRTKP